MNRLTLGLRDSNFIIELISYYAFSTLNAYKFVNNNYSYYNYNFNCNCSCSYNYNYNYTP